PNMFGDADGEMGMIQNTLGDFPLIGFYAGGEVSFNRLYTYTGVLTLFL
ncbi:MAG: histidine kinase, partial [Rhodospirillaceae bacterium]|nr:histidine kinase [Rhodospirillaceae bacterium]